MALDATKLERIGGGTNGLFLYNSADAYTTISASGYFNAVTGRLRQWDVIICVSATGGTPLVDVAVVTSATGAATVTTTLVEGLTTS